MDLTNLYVARREKALLVGDYNTYRTQLSRRILVLRQKLKYTSKGKKYPVKAPVTAHNIGENQEWVVQGVVDSLL